MLINGWDYSPFKGAFSSYVKSGQLAARWRPKNIPQGNTKIKTLEEVVDLINDGDTISYPHYYRTGDKVLEQIVALLRSKGRKDVRIFGNAFFDNTDPWLINALKDGIIGGIYGNPYGKIGSHIMTGNLLPWVTIGFSHGNRARKIEAGEVNIKVAFAPVAYSDIYGNANGVMGDPSHWCGPVSFFLPDSQYAEYVCVVAGTISDRLTMSNTISMENVDFVVKVDNPGLSAHIASGTLDVASAKAKPFNVKVANNVNKVIDASGVIKDGFNFQVGSGAGLLVLDNIRNLLKEKGVQANFSIGGITSTHVEMLEEGTLHTLLHGQCFDPSTKVIESLRDHPRHVDMTSHIYANLARKENAVNMLDVAVLSALELDLDFNVNTVCANGRIVGGIGGGQDVAAGADLTIMFLPLATAKDDKAFPRIVEKVYTKVTPGEVIDVVVTEDYVCVNPASKSRRKDALINGAKKAGLDLISIENLHHLSIKKALSMGKLQPKTETTDEIVHAIEWRDGTLLDVIRKPARSE